MTKQEELKRTMKRVKYVIITAISIFSITMVISLIYAIYTYLKKVDMVFCIVEVWLVLNLGILLSLFSIWKDYKKSEESVNYHIKDQKNKLQVAESYHLKADKFVEIMRACEDEEYDFINDNAQYYARLIISEEEIEGIEIEIKDAAGKILVKPIIVENFAYFQVTYKLKI